MVVIPHAYANLFLSKPENNLDDSEGKSLFKEQDEAWLNFKAQEQ